MSPKKKPHGETPAGVCPNCGKLGMEEYMPFRPGMEYKCKYCGYVGPFHHLEEKEESEENANEAESEAGTGAR